MQIGEALKILQALADGADPSTGEVFSFEGPYQHPQTVRALTTAIRALERQQERERRIRFLPGNAGNPWSEAEQEQLCRDFDVGISIKELASRLGRTQVAIQSRLVKLGRITLPSSSIVSSLSSESRSNLHHSKP
ncbi:MAG: hypothetical protein ACYC92_07900 [Candidatus Acidiferrales bacterium]